MKRILSIFLVFAIIITLSACKNTDNNYFDENINSIDNENNIDTTKQNVLFGKLVVYDGDSICESRKNNGGAYPTLIAKEVGCRYLNNASGGKRLALADGKKSVVADLSKLPTFADIYCFQGGFNDYWTPAEIGKCDFNDFEGELDASTICGALETIFRYSRENFKGKAICFIITHKCGDTGHKANSLGYTFDDYRQAMITVCEKYSIPYYDAFAQSGLDGGDETQSKLYMTANAEETPDGIHPNEEAYKKYYVPQLIELFTSLFSEH